MYANLHALPPDKAMYTLYVGQPGDPLEVLEEYDQVGPKHTPEHRHLTSLVVEAAREGLIADYGDKVQVRGVIDQSAGVILYDSRIQGFRPIPVMPPAMLIASFERPLDAFIDLCQDAHDGYGTDEYLDFLTREG